MNALLWVSFDFVLQVGPEMLVSLRLHRNHKGDSQISLDLFQGS